MNHMMEWGSDVWFFLIFAGIICFLLISLILLHFLKRGTNKLEGIESSYQQSEQKELKSNQHLERIRYCPECGAKLDVKQMVYCPACGHKI